MTRKAELWRIDALRKNIRAKHYHVTFEPLFDDPGTVDLSGINWIVVGTMTGAQSRKIHTEPEWAWSLADQAHKLGIWQHTLNCVTEDLVHSIRTLAQLCWSVEALTTWITSVTSVNLISFLDRKSVV